MLDKGYISFSFDDGREDNYDIYKSILKPMNIPATFNIAAGYIDGTCPVKSIPSTTIKSMTVEQVREIYKDGLVEIALHGDKHLNTEEDIMSGEEKIRKWLFADQNKHFGFASPGSGLNIAQYLASSSKYLKKGLLYVRTHQRYFRHAKLKIFSRKVARVTHCPQLFLYAYKDSLMDKCLNKVIYSVPVLKDTSVSEIKALINYAVKYKLALVLMFHSIVEDLTGHDNFSWSRDKFKELCHYISTKSKRELEIITTSDMHSILNLGVKALETA